MARYIAVMSWKLIASLAAPFLTGLGGFLLTFVNDWRADRQLAVWAGILVLAGLACTCYVVVRDWREAEGAAQAADAALTATATSLASCLEDLDQLAPQTAVKRTQMLRGVQATAITELLRILDTRHRNGRAILFVLDQKQTSAEPEVRKGRRDPTTPFQQGTERGDAALKFMREGLGDICNDVDADPWDGWSGTRSRYRVFMSTPVAEGDRVYGLLTYDLPQTGELTHADLDLLEAFATFIGVACNYAQARA